VIAVHVRAASGSTRLASLDCVGRTDWSGLIVRREQSTNTVQSLPPTVARAQPHPQVEQTIQHAISRYDDLLRRLAD
jgi:uncharacterized protein HemX